MSPTVGSITVAPLSRERWADFAAVMGPKGGAGGCWCMLWRLTKGAHDKGAGAGNRAAMKKLAERARPPGLLAYRDGTPVGWISVAPRREFPRLAASRVLAPVDDAAVWSVSCFLVARSERGRGVALRLLEAACDFAREHGGTILEGYPIEPRTRPYPAIYAWTGFARVFERAGDREGLRNNMHDRTSNG